MNNAPLYKIITSDSNHSITDCRMIILDYSVIGIMLACSAMFYANASWHSLLLTPLSYVIDQSRNIDLVKRCDIV
jgi:hypothetical protein